MQMKVTAEAPSRPHAAAVAIARACLPSTETMEGGGEKTVAHTEAAIAKLLPESLPAWRAANLALSEAARPFTGGRALHEISVHDAEALVVRWSSMPLMRAAINGIAALYKTTHFDLPNTKGSLRVPLPTIENVEQPRWLQQIIRAEDFDIDEELECDVVVMGTGAGGAVVGRHLADQGHAVVFVEEGENVRRNEFPRNFLATFTDLYRNVMTVGNAAMLIPRGALLGGSTAVNTGTSFRPPRWVTDRWCEELGSNEFSTDALAPYFDRVETTLQVEPADTKYAGPIYDLFSQGCKELGWHYDTVQRNAPGCRGEGMCDNGCPTDARRSTNISYLPPALERGAMVLTGLLADRVILEGGRAVGLEGVALDKRRRPVKLPNGKNKRVRIKANTVILAGGTLGTAKFLLEQGIANSSHQVGRNLTVHPSGPTTALFDERIDGDKYIPQTIYSDHFLNERIMLISALAETHMLPPLLPFLGKRLMDVLDQHAHIANIGFMIAESARGRLRLGPNGRSIVTYNLTKEDTKRVHRAQVLASELLLAAGAKEVYPGMLFPITLRNRKDLEEFRRRKVGTGDFMLTAYHPLGTCRMSSDPRRGVVDLNHQCHDVPGLFIVDGSTVPGPLGVNPQISVMGLATRAAEKIGELID